MKVIFLDCPDISEANPIGTYRFSKMKLICFMIFGLLTLLVHAQIRNPDLIEALENFADSIENCEEYSHSTHELGIVEFIDYNDSITFCIRLTEDFIAYRRDLIEKGQYYSQLSKTFFAGTV